MCRLEQLLAALTASHGFWFSLFEERPVMVTKQSNGASITKSINCHF